MSKRYLNVCAAQAGTFIVIITEEGEALVLPVVAWVNSIHTLDNGSEWLDTDPLVSDSLASDPGGPELVDIWGDTVEWKTFAPGENPLAWAERFETEYGRKITSWNVSTWMPSTSPVFATADEVLWTNDFIPPPHGDEDESLT